MVQGNDGAIITAILMVVVGVKSHNVSGVINRWVLSLIPKRYQDNWIKE